MDDESDDSSDESESESEDDVITQELSSPMEVKSSPSQEHAGGNSDKAQRRKTVKGLDKFGIQNQLSNQSTNFT